MRSCQAGGLTDIASPLTPFRLSPVLGVDQTHGCFVWVRGDWRRASDALASYAPGRLDSGSPLARVGCDNCDNPVDRSAWLAGTWHTIIAAMATWEAMAWSVRVREMCGARANASTPSRCPLQSPPAVFVSPKRQCAIAPCRGPGVVVARHTANGAADHALWRLTHGLAVVKPASQHRLLIGRIH